MANLKFRPAPKKQALSDKVIGMKEGDVKPGSMTTGDYNSSKASDSSAARASKVAGNSWAAAGGDAEYQQGDVRRITKRVSSQSGGSNLGDKTVKMEKAKPVSGGTKKMIWQSKQRVNKSTASPQAKKAAKRLY